MSDTLLLPADGTASGFYVTNARNRFIGNAASGGWSGFQFPTLQEPIGMHRASGLPPPRLRPTLEFRGNTAHSSGYYRDRRRLHLCRRRLVLSQQQRPSSSVQPRAQQHLQVVR